jgi:predicted metalloprotease
MPSRLRSSLAAFGLAATALLVGGPEKASEYQMWQYAAEAGSNFSPDDTRAITTTYDETISIVGGLAATRLVFISGHQSYTCPGSEPIEVRSTHGAMYCGQNNTVIMTAWGLGFTKTIEGAQTPKERTAITKYVIAHELGHAVQVLVGVRLSVPTGLSTEQATAYIRHNELDADCLATRILVLTGQPTDALYAMQAFGKTILQNNNDPEHGTQLERLAALSQGYSGGTLCGLPRDPFTPVTARTATGR